MAHGATDEIDFHAVEDRHYVTDLHATVLRQLGLDPHKLEVSRPETARDRIRQTDQAGDCVRRLQAANLELAESLNFPTNVPERKPEQSF